MAKLIEYLPFIIPLLILQLLLFSYTVYHVLTHKSYKRGTRALWICLSFINFIGPILYFVIGKEDS